MEVLNEVANRLARETGFIQWEGNFDGADRAHSLICGWFAEPEITLEGLCQIVGRRDVALTSFGLSQRFCEKAATFFQQRMEELSSQW